MARLMVWFVIAALVASLSAPSHAEQVVELPGGRALLNRPAGAASVGLVLLTGGDGQIGIGPGGRVQRGGNWIVRTRGAYAASGVASLLIDGDVDVGAAIAHMRAVAPRVMVVAMSRGALKVAPALAHRPDGVVFASAMLTDARVAIGDAARLPPTLVVHHQLDTCRVTAAGSVTPFLAWAGSRARVVWIDGGTSQGDVCQRAPITASSAARTP
ncbi:MAG: alpha/beta hydrolase [Rhodospirillales bacterium]|nr:MAG: alpha/beta hydrolase [Rhodospirillales bacterium]